MKNFVEFVTSGAEVRRYHTVTTLREETVGHHSHGVALLCYALDPQCSARVLLAALAHDLAEQLVGDIPSPAKRTLGFADQLDTLEDSILAANRLGFTLTEHERRVLKLADIAQGALFCAREVELGNRRMRTVFDRYLSYAEGMILSGNERTLFDHIRTLV